MTGPIERPWWRGGGWGLAFGSFGLAVAAVAALALGADDIRLLRLGIVAALWAALLGAFAAARMRRELRTTAERADELRTVYQSELEREIAARQEHEQTVERELRQQVEESQQADIAALRTELYSLRDTLQHLLGGDVLVERERVALRESTRLRSLPDHSRTVPSTEALARSPRNVTVSDWPVTEVESESLPAARRVPLPAEPPVEIVTVDRRHDPLESITGTWNGRSWGAETVRTAASVEPPRPWRTEPQQAPDPVSSDRTWSPAVSWKPSAEGAAPETGVPEAGVPGIGADRGRRYRTDRDPLEQVSVGNGRHGWKSESNGTPSSAQPSTSWETLASNGSRTAPRRPESTNGNESRTQDPVIGAHRGGRSVQDLLAAYGESSAPRHRRRRKDN